MSDSLDRVGAGSAQKRGGEDAADNGKSAKSRSMPAEPGNRRAQDLLMQVAAEPIHRLKLVKGGSEHRELPVDPSDLRIEPEDIERLCRMLIRGDIGAATAFVERRRSVGLDLETLYLDLLAPAARRLGDLWTEDLCDFGDVTVGLCRLQQLLRSFSPHFVHEEERDQRMAQHRALLVTVPGEQHSFGLFMVAEFFRKDGWDVSTATPASRDELASLVRHEWFDVVGVSSSCEDKLEAIGSAIRTIRRASRNRAPGILVGGPIFVEHPEYADLIGADATAKDGRSAPQEAEKLLALISRR